MMFLKKFWKGDIAPGEGRYHPSREYAQLMQTLEKCEEKLKASLSEEDFHTFRAFAEAALESACMESCDNFVDGFRQGARMMMDVLMDS